jgi:hypothetical protein
MKVELRHVLVQEAPGAENIYVAARKRLDWMPDMPVPVNGDILMDEKGNWTTVLRRTLMEFPPFIALKVTDLNVNDVEAWLAEHGWERDEAEDDPE